MKFGGTSIESASAIKRVTEIIKAEINNTPILIFSAMGKTTRNLLNAARAVACGNKHETRDVLLTIVDYHHKILKECCCPELLKDAQENLIQHLSELQKLFEGLLILKDLNNKIQDKILSYGEILSSTIIHYALRSEGLNSVWLDSRELIITDDNFSQATPILSLTESKIQNAIISTISNGGIPTLQGFIGSNKNGHTTTLGFEGSDFSAALVGSAINADSIILWKTVDGIMSADPKKVSDAIKIDQLSYSEASTLTYLGASCVHAKAIAPAQKCSIPIYIKDSTSSNSCGTVICHQAINSGAKSITQYHDVVMIKIATDNWQNANELLFAITDILKNKKINILGLNLSLNIMTIILDHNSYKDISDQLAILTGDCTQIFTDLNLVSLVGNDLHKGQTIQDKILQATDNIFDRTISIMSENSISYLFKKDLSDHSIKRIHQLIFQESISKQSRKTL